jgi:predicted DNA-binding protein with PD1-like motif
MKPPIALLAFGIIAGAVGAALARARPPASKTPTVPPGLKVRLIRESGGNQTYQLVFERGAEAMGTLSAFILENGFAAVHFQGLGACTDAVVAYYDPAAREYRKTTYEQPMEIVSIIGDAAPTGGGAGLHAHISLGSADGSLHGGHLVEARVSPTLELELTASPVAMARAHDAELNAELLVP